MKKAIFLLLLASPCLGEGPLFRHKDPAVNREVVNIYQDLRNITDVSSSTLPSGSTNYAQINPSTQQSGAINVASGTLTNFFATTATFQNINGSGVWGFRNRIINGDMRIDQRNAGAAYSLNGVDVSYTLDRWAGSEQSDAVISIQQLSATPPTGFTHYLRVIATTADASIGSSQYSYLQQQVEGTNFKEFLFGSASAKTVTVSFWVRSSLTGSFSGAALNSAQNRSYPFSYSISAADTWEKKTVTFTGDTTGTWLTTTGTGIRIIWDLGIGTDFRGTAGAWVAGFKAGVTGSVSLISTLNATWDITGVQLEIGSQATEFEYRPDAVELQLCQRYFEKSYNQATALGASAGGSAYSVSSSASATSAAKGSVVFFKVTKRASPSVTGYLGTGTLGSWHTRNASNSVNGNGTFGAADVCDTKFQADVTSVAGSPLTTNVNYFNEGHWAASAEL